jgi:hypothetical protein
MLPSKGTLALLQRQASSPLITTYHNKWSDLPWRCFIPPQEFQHRSRAVLAPYLLLQFRASWSRMASIPTNRLHSQHTQQRKLSQPWFRTSNSFSITSHTLSNQLYRSHSICFPRLNTTLHPYRTRSKRNGLMSLRNSDSYLCRKVNHPTTRPRSPIITLEFQRVYIHRNLIERRLDA